MRKRDVHDLAFFVFYIADQKLLECPAAGQVPAIGASPDKTGRKGGVEETDDDVLGAALPAEVPCAKLF